MYLQQLIKGISGGGNRRRSRRSIVTKACIRLEPDGSAVIRAAEDARQKLLEKSARLFDVPPSDLDTEDGMVFVKGV